MKNTLVTARLLLILPAFLQVACYSYVPATLETVPEQATLRALLTPAAQERLRAVYGVTPDGPTLSGKLVARDGDTVGLYVQSVPIGTGVGTRPLYQQVEVARADILRVDLRRVDKLRTGVLLGVAASALGFAGYQAFIGKQTVVTPPPPPPPAESVRRWAVRVSIPWP